VQQYPQPGLPSGPPQPQYQQAPPAHYQQTPPGYQQVPPAKPKGGGRKVAGILLMVFGVLPLLLSGAVVVKTFSNAQQQIPNNAFAATAWHNLRTDEIFPDHLAISTVGDNAQGWSRQGIAKEGSCAEAFRKDLAEAAAGDGCTTALRATYVDIGGTMAATIGVGVVGSYQQAGDLADQFDWASDPGPMVYPVAVAGTPAAQWNKDLAMKGGTATVGLSTNSPPYFAAITVGPTDGSRSVGKLPGEWASDGKSEGTTYWHVASQLVTAYANQFDETMVGR
jgi:hypothetical protein